MKLDESYIYRNEVDWSLLHQGLTIPTRLQVAFKSLLRDFERGVGRKVTLLINGQPFEAMLINQNLDQESHATLMSYRSDTPPAADCRKCFKDYFRQAMNI
jgi:5-methylcytosine-specific restriction enzyme A